MTGDTTALETATADRAFEIATTLAGEIGARRPTSSAERIAAEVVREALRGDGLDATTERFAAYSSFAHPFGVIAALSVFPVLLPRRRRVARGALAGLAAALLASEGGLLRTPLSDLLARRESRNVVATVEPRSRVARTVCLLAHMDTSRSGLLFHPAFAAQLNRWITVQWLATLLLPAEPLLARRRPGRALIATARAISTAGLALVAERELRGVDVPGANDNASGVGVVLQLAAETAARPLESTRLVILITGSEESGLLGARAFLRERDTSGWLFVNFDSVGSTATLRYTRAEGLMPKWRCDARLVAVADRLARDDPRLGLEAVDGPIGLTYDTTAVLAAGGRAITFVAGDDGRIPNYHRPSDTVENLDRKTLARAVSAGRGMVGLIDRGDADQQ